MLRGHLLSQTVADQQQVSDTVRKEQFGTAGIRPR
jgi:hypothetical protein